MRSIKDKYKQLLEIFWQGPLVATHIPSVNPEFFVLSAKSSKLRAGALTLLALSSSYLSAKKYGQFFLYAGCWGLAKLQAKSR